MAERVPHTQRELIAVGRHTVAISNPEKVLFPARGYTKRDLVQY